jgi:bacterial leucyl aminopeptidase
MGLPNRFDLTSVFFVGALFLACGPSSLEVDNGSGGTSGSGGAGGAGISDAGDETPPGDIDARDSPSTVDAAVADGTTPPDDGSTREDLIREMLGRLKVAEIEAKTRELESKSLPDRFTKSPNYTAATEWIRDFMAIEAPNAAVRFDEWEGYRNVEFTIKGTDPAAGLYIIGGHLDGVRNTVAMDDDGSGAVGVALIARALSFYRYKADIRCVLFDNEEGGLIGSAHYAQALKASGCEADTCLKVYINLDEIAYDPNNRLNLRIWSDSAELKNLNTQVNMTYGLGLTLTMGTGSCHRSDDCSFSAQGYTTIYNFQTTQSPYYHMPGDTSDTLNFTYLTKNLQITAGVVATAAVPIGRVP